MPRHEDPRGIYEYKGVYYKVTSDIIHVKNPTTRKWEHYIPYTEETDQIRISERRYYARKQEEFHERFRRVADLPETPNFNFKKGFKF